MGFLNKKKAIKNIRYYLSEIIIVVIGIFIAIQLNNLNENRKNNIEEKKSLNRIIIDLKTEKHILEYYTKDIAKSHQFLKDVIYKEKKKNLDSLYIHISKVFFHYKYNSEYINLKYSGKLNMISNDTIRYQLSRYYEAGYPFYQEIAESHKEFNNKYVSSFFRKEFPSDTTNILNLETVLRKINNKELKEIIIEQINQYNFIIKNVKIDETENLIKFIKKELKNN